MQTCSRLKLTAVIGIVIGLFMSGCVSHRDNSDPIDQVPMYGNMNRDAIPELKAADETLIQDTTNHYGSRKKASDAFVDQGFHYYYQDNLVYAMRRFNQAWILDTENPDVFWGFSAVLHDQGDNCGALNMLEQAILLNESDDERFYADAGRCAALCAVSNNRLTEVERNDLLNQSEMFFADAEKSDVDKANLYSLWATAYYWRGDYDKAWQMVAKAEDQGGQLPDAFINLLSTKLARPL